MFHVRFRGTFNEIHIQPSERTINGYMYHRRIRGFARDISIDTDMGLDR